MSFFPYDNNVVLNVTINLNYIISTHDSDQLESSLATLVIVHD